MSAFKYQWNQTIDVGTAGLLSKQWTSIRHILSLLVTANACVHVTAYVAVRRSLSTTYTAVVLGLLLRQYVSYQFGVWAGKRVTTQPRGGYRCQCHRRRCGVQWGRLPLQQVGEWLSQSGRGFYQYKRIIFCWRFGALGKAGGAQQCTYILILTWPCIVYARARLITRKAWLLLGRHIWYQLYMVFT